MIDPGPISRTGVDKMSLVGQRVERREDPPLLTGGARYVADLESEKALHVAFVRSPVAHGLVTSIELDGALCQPGVVAAFTADDLGLRDIPEFPLEDGSQRPELGRPCLARGRVRFVGEAIVVVVAETEAEAVDAAEQVVVEIEELQPVLDPESALDEDAPLLFPEFGSNLVLSVASLGSDDVLEEAEVVVRAEFTNQRVAPVPMETNAALIRPLPGGRLECFVSCQAPFAVRSAIALALGKETDDVRVCAPAVGGGFGAKGGVYPEQIVTAAVAERLGRPAIYIETRSENLLAMTHGRGQRQQLALGATRDGLIVGLEARTITDVGAYCWRGSIPFRTSRLMATGVYRIPRLSLTSLGVVTNTSPTGPYRGAGRPEATAMLERAIELLADELGMDSIELRRRNFLRPTDFPYRTETGADYDSGDYELILDRVLSEAGYGALRAEQERRRRAGGAKQLGIGISAFVEVSGSGPEYGSLEVLPDGTIVVTTGSSPHGQGHETTLSQLASGLFRVPTEQVRIIHSDTAVVPRGIGTFGSRSGQLAGNAVYKAGLRVLELVREAAADLLEASVGDLVITDNGDFSVIGVPSRSVTLAEVAASVPAGQLRAGDDFAQPDGTYPFGVHLALVEVDTETGQPVLLRLVAGDDCGTVLNPTIVEGQLHGGLAQGIGQALYEHFIYDEVGNPLTTTLADYGIPSAAELPYFEVLQTCTPSPRNPLGMKGIGESGTVGAAPAVQNAILDALRPYGVRHLDMPLTPERIWRAIRQFSEATAAT